MGENGPFSVRIDDDLETDIEHYADENNISKGKALTKFAERGRLEFGYAGGQSPTLLEEISEQLFQMGFILGLAFLLMSFGSTNPLMFSIAAASFSVAAVANLVIWAEPRLTGNLRRRTKPDAEPVVE